MKDLSHGLQPGNNYFEEWDGGKSTINYGATGLLLLDTAVQQAEEQGIKYIMCLTNNWDNYGGMPTYVENMVGDGQSQTNFYNNPVIVNQFKTYVTAIVNRYKDSPAIFAWELANEVCTFAAIVASSIDFHTDEYLRLAANHRTVPAPPSSPNGSRTSHLTSRPLTQATWSPLVV